MAHPSLHYLSHGYPTGYGVAGVRMARALVDAGVPLRWTPVDFHHELPLFAPEQPAHPVLDRHRGGPRQADAMILHAIPELLPAVARHRGDAALICHTVWETERLQAHWPDLLNGCDGVIVPTEWNAAAFRRSGVSVPIEVVPHVRADLTAPADDEWLQDVGGRFTVYSIAAWEDRKMPWRTIEAYARAFAPDDDVQLVLKSDRLHRSGDPRFQGPGPRERDTSWALAMVLRELGPTPPITLVDGILTDAQIAGLHQRGDCWLSLPHAEGWDIGAFDAAVAGTPLITTGWGGPAEYLDPSAAHLVPVDLVPSQRPPRAPDPTSPWAEPRLDAAVEALRWVRSQPDAARRRARGQARSLAQRYAPAVVAGELMAAVDRILAAR